MKKYIEEFRKLVMGMSEEDLGVITDKFIKEGSRSAQEYWRK